MKILVFLYFLKIFNEQIFCIFPIQIFWRRFFWVIYHFTIFVPTNFLSKFNIVTFLLLPFNHQTISMLFTILPPTHLYWILSDLTTKASMFGTILNNPFIDSTILIKNSYKTIRPRIDLLSNKKCINIIYFAPSVFHCHKVVSAFE